MWEEPPISGKNGSGTIFFTGCNLRCIFCQNHDISTGDNMGKEVTPEELNEMFFELIEQGAHNINLVTPTHYADKIAEALRIRKLPVPVVYNCGGYESVETLRMFEGLVDIWLPDFKYAEDKLGESLSKVNNYSSVAEAALTEMLRQQPQNVFDENGMMLKGVIVRHLILPLHTKNSIAVLETMAEKFPGVLVSLMAQYTPIKEFEDFPELNRGITKREYDKVLDKMDELGIDGFVQDRTAKGEKFIPDFSMFSKKPD
ncbi:MAG: radical SAM protein [Clostridia bacterium]|nr:radical SAM protein [Clostridia bacterium]